MIRGVVVGEVDVVVLLLAQGPLRAGLQIHPGIPADELVGGIGLKVPHELAVEEVPVPEELLRRAEIHGRQLLQVAVDGVQPPLAVGGLLLQAHQGDVQVLAPGHHLVDGVLQLPDHVGVVRLELPVLDGVKYVPQGVVALVQGVGGLAGPHENHHPLGLGDVVELPAQVLVHLVVVDVLDSGDVLNENSGVEALRPDAVVQIPPGHRPLRVGFRLRLGLLRFGSARLGGLLLLDRLLGASLLLVRLGGHGGEGQRAGQGQNGQQHRDASFHGRFLRWIHASACRLVIVVIIAREGKLSVNCPKARLGENTGFFRHPALDFVEAHRPEGVGSLHWVYPERLS